MELGNLQRAVVIAEADDRSSFETKPIRRDCSVGLLIIMSILRTMKTAEAVGKSDVKGSETKKIVEEACVRTMVLTVPIRLASLGAARLATPMMRLLTPPLIGPLKIGRAHGSTLV